jgi:MCP family monocarboxylic acid transporter-like MFS transporter 10
MGVVAMGSSLGGTLLPIAAKNLIPRVGSVYFTYCEPFPWLMSISRFQWTMRIFGFILFVTLGASNLVTLNPLNQKQTYNELSFFSSY